jgi:hypothetical protein
MSNIWVEFFKYKTVPSHFWTSCCCYCICRTRTESPFIWNFPNRTARRFVNILWTLPSLSASSTISINEPKWIVCKNRSRIRYTWYPLSSKSLIPKNGAFSQPLSIVYRNSSSLTARALNFSHTGQNLSQPRKPLAKGQTSEWEDSIFLSPFFVLVSPC